MSGLHASVAGLVLAAGQSTRMGRPKMTLAWGNGTVIGQVIQCILEGGAAPVMVVTGAARPEVEGCIDRLPVGKVHNPGYALGEMLSSVQVGLRAFVVRPGAVLIALGDQPQVQVETVKALIAAYQDTQAQIIVPSYQKHRGHPWLVGEKLWDEILGLQSPQTLRDFLDRHSAEIHYLVVSSSSVLQDLDTPEQYETYRPK